MKEVLLSGFEPESKPRKGFMIGRYTTGAGVIFQVSGMRMNLYNFFTFVKPYIIQMNLPWMRCARW
jgi:hypothetical protein